MRRLLRAKLVAAPLLLAAGCAHQPVEQRNTLAALRKVQPDMQEVRVDQGLDNAIASYRNFLEAAPDSGLTPEAMRRLADLQIEKAYGVLGDGEIVELDADSAAAVVRTAPNRAPVQMVAPEAAGAVTLPAGVAQPVAATGLQGPANFEQELEQRAVGSTSIVKAASDGVALPEGTDPALVRAGPHEAIKLYDELLEKYPHYEFRDQVLYQKARALDELGRTADSMAVMQQLVDENPGSRFVDEVQFRRAEQFFMRRKFRDAENAYQSIVAAGPSSDYYELALYKLGWSLYKQDMYEEALHNYFALLDYKVSRGFDFDAKHTPAEERRIEDTFQVTSLSFSNLGGPEVIGQYFESFGHRDYEDRVYRYLGTFYLGKLRYHDAATVYKSFVKLYPIHVAAPDFSARTIGIYEAGGFPMLVLESKKAFAASYGIKAEYWRHHEIAGRPEVLGALRGNLTDLANYYHAQYQDKEQAKNQSENYSEAARWYREFLISFHEDPQAPQINYQLADLMRENGDFALSAAEYERTAYDYPAHEKSAAAGYAAVFAYREQLKVAASDAQEAVRRQTVSSSLKFADAFPGHDQAPVILVAAAQDLYDMKEFAAAREAGRKLLDKFPVATPQLRRTAQLVVAHSSFELADYPTAELAYTQVLAATSAGDASRSDLVETLAASIYKQGELANEQGDYRAAADHFLRVREATPEAKIRAGAEYDAGAALIRLQDWKRAAQIMDEFRRNNPTHQLVPEATKQVAHALRQAGELSSSAGEYERVARESTDQALRAEALLLAGDLYEQSQEQEKALATFLRYATEFPKPVEGAVEARSRIAAIYKARNDGSNYLLQLKEIVRADANAGAERTGRTRTVAARAALVLAEPLYGEFAALKLAQPFETSLQQKQRAMEATLSAFDKLVGYEVADVTAAATYYMAETYGNFGHSLLESERPKGLSGTALQNYEDQLDEEAFPFEEKAILLHEKNFELLGGGLYGQWIEKSLARLAELKPARYARAELSSGFIGSLDRYEYHRPAVVPEQAATVANDLTNGYENVDAQ